MKIKANLKSNQKIIEADKIDATIEHINKLSKHKEDGQLSEYMTYLYYVAFKDLEYELLEGRLTQEFLGDYIFGNTEEYFTVDSKNSHTFNKLPKLGISLSHWDKNDEPYYGVDPVKDTNYSWLYYSNCDKLACYNYDFRCLYIIESWSIVKRNLLKEYVTENMKPKYKNIRQLNNKLGFTALEEARPKYDNAKYEYDYDGRRFLIDYSTKTELLSLTLNEEVIKELGSELTIVQFEY